MNQGHSGVKEVIQEKQSKHCLVTVERGSFYPNLSILVSGGKETNEDSLSNGE